jgi:hypothetical protein
MVESVERRSTLKPDRGASEGESGEEQNVYILHSEFQQNS